MYKRVPIIGSDGSRYESINSLHRAIGGHRPNLLKFIRSKGGYVRNGVVYKMMDMDDAVTRVEYKNATVIAENIRRTPEEEKEYLEFLESKKVADLPFEKFDFRFASHTRGSRYAIALFSDAHIEETVKPSSVLGLNEYNVKIAEERIQRYFVNLASCINEDEVRNLIFASLGDSISGYIHDELSQCNELSPLEATYKAQSLIFGGLKYLCDNCMCLDHIKFVGICGNHSRTTKKIQHANGYRMSYEWFMYRNIVDRCEAEGLPIDFSIPESEMAIVDMEDRRRFIFIHGFQIKGGGTNTVCGIYPSLNRLCMRYDKTFHQDKLYLGHFHSCVSIPNAMVNGSIIGYNSFSLTNGFPYEEPAQMYQVFDSEVGELLTRKIYCK